MNKSTILAEIRARRPLFEAKGITHVYLFGSVMRDQHGESSDVDLFFDHAIPNFGAFDYVGLKQMAEDVLPFAVDFIARNSLHPAIRPQIEATAEQVF